MQFSDMFSLQNILVFSATVFIWSALVSDSIHFYYCRRAKRLQKPVCRCWDCALKCELYKLPK